jgi:hypothetical protein
MCTMKKGPETSLTLQAMQALADAVAKVVEDHRRREKPLAVWRNGKAVWIPATEAGALQETPTSYRSRSSGSKA